MDCGCISPSFSSRFEVTVTPAALLSLCLCPQPLHAAGRTHNQTLGSSSGSLYFLPVHSPTAALTRDVSTSHRASAESTSTSQLEDEEPCDVTGAATDVTLPTPLVVVAPVGAGPRAPALAPADAEEEAAPLVMAAAAGLALWPDSSDRNLPMPTWPCAGCRSHHTRPPAATAAPTIRATVVQLPTTLPLEDEEVAVADSSSPPPPMYTSAGCAFCCGLAAEAGAAAALAASTDDAVLTSLAAEETDDADMAEADAGATGVAAAAAAGVTALAATVAAGTGVAAAAAGATTAAAAGTAGEGG